MTGVPHLPIIRRIKVLRDIGIFHDYTAHPNTPAFQRYNLIYGFNGTGKTTISRLLRQLDSGRPPDNLPRASQFEIELTDDTVVTRTSNLDALSGRLLVFNNEFVTENLRWSEGRAKPVFYLGVETSRLSKLLELLERRAPARRQKLADADAEHRASERALNLFYTTRARPIAETLGLGRQYDARHLKSDYSSRDRIGWSRLEPSQRESLLTLVNTRHAFQELTSIPFDGEALREAFRRARSICESTVTSITLDALASNPSMTRWAKEGLEYHQQRNLTHCVFCGSDLTSERMLQLQDALGDAVNLFFSELNNAVEQLRTQGTRLREWSYRLPADQAISPHYAHTYRDATASLENLVAIIHQMMATTNQTLSEKAQLLAVPHLPDELATDHVIETPLRELEGVVAIMNRVIAEHNAQQQEFSSRQSQAKEELRHDMILEAQEEHDRLIRDLETAKVQFDRRKRLHEKLAQCLAMLRVQVRDHGPAVGRMNERLKAYLGHEELRLETFEEGYQIVRHGEPLRGPLSEGERTAIALCYFLCKLDEQGRHLNEQVVVVDDPISSLDAGALNYAFNLLRSLLQGAQQVIILTHNLSYMNEIKKWLKAKPMSDTSSLFFIKCWLNSERRRSGIIEMPKLLKAYDSEYQYMFSLIRTCILADGNPDEIPVFIMPNVMRRVLELFLAFKAPGTESLAQKLGHSLVIESGLDNTRLHALNRLTHVESHSDSMDDFISFSTMTIEEVFSAADALMNLIRTLDQHHYDRLCKLSA